jgi:hypothetical protein
MQTTKLQYNLGLLAEAFDLNVVSDCQHLREWLDYSFTLDEFEERSLTYLHEQVKIDGKYWNEEELKIRFIGGLFTIANIDTPNRIKVFYERPLAASIQNHHLAVVTDCLVATPLKFNTPSKPYFFLQEYKKGRGEAKDPEAQMLLAMLIAQEKNQDGQPLYGSYVIGNNLHFATLMGKDYCTSPQYDATDKNDLLQIVFTLRNLKNIILQQP